MISFLVPLLIIVVLILINALFVAAEFAIIGVRPTRIAQLAEEGNGTATQVKTVLDSTVLQDRYIATAQLGVTMASLGLGMYGEHAIAEWLLGPLEGLIQLAPTTALAIAAVVSLALLTFAHVVVGEIVPKSLALQFAERTALALSGLMRVMQMLFYPAVLLLNMLGNSLLRLFNIPIAPAHARLYSPEELELLVTESAEGGLISDNEQQLLHNIFDFGERRVGQVMTPRLRMQAVAQGIGEAELRSVLAASSHSRLPVYDDDLDHMVGVLLLKDFVRQQLDPQQLFAISALLRPLPMVPDTMPIERLLASFKRSHNQIALVVDEYGGTAGLVTLEDLVEEVVGEVQDEFDQAERPPLIEVEPGVLLAQGSLLLADLRENLAVDLADAAGADVETIGGLIVSQLGRPAHIGDELALAHAILRVERVQNLAVQEVRITILPVPAVKGRE